MVDKIPKVLLLDDDPNLRGVLSDILKIKGFESIPVDTGAAALAFIKQQDIDVILIDIKLAGISGLDVLRSIKSQSPETECIMLTGHASQATAIEAVNLGAYSYFQKPYEVDQLLVAIRRAAEKHSASHALLEREARFRSLIENSSDLICILNPDATLRYISPSLEHLLGYTPDDVVIGTGLQGYIYPEELPAFIETFHKLVQSSNPAPVSMQLRIRHKNESWRILEGTGTNQLNDPAIKGIIINAHDITSRIQAEQDLRRMVDRWSIVYRAGEAIGAGLDTEQVFAAVNHAVEQVMPCEDFVISLYDEKVNEMEGNYILENKRRISPNPYQANHGLGGYVVLSGKSLILNNPEEIKASGIEFVPYGTGPDTASVLAVPLMLKGKATGMISAQSYQPGAYSATDRELLEMLASHAAVAIDNARLFERAQQEIKERKHVEENLLLSQAETAHANRLLLALNQAAQTVQRARTISEVYQAVQTQLSQLGYHTTGFEISGEDRSLHISYINYKAGLIRKAEKATGILLRNFKFRPGKNSIYQRAIQQGETVFVTDPSQAVVDTVPRKFRSIASSITSLFKLDQSIFTPLKVGDETIGILAVTGPGISTADIPAIAAFGNQAAIALQNARLYEQAQQEIVERTHAEEALAASDAELRALFSSMQDVVMVIDRSGVYLKVAPTNPELLVVPDGGLVGKNLRDIFPHEQAENFIQVVQKVLDTKQTIQIQYDLVVGGKIVWFETSISPMTETSTLWVARDITERFMAEKALLEAEKNYHSLFENVPDGVYRSTLDGKYLSVNPALARIFGYSSPDELHNVDIARDLYLSPEARQSWANVLLQKGELRNSETTMRRKDGQQISVLENTQVIRDWQGKALYFEGTLSDITEHRKAEDALRKSESSLQAVLQSTADGILAVGSDNQVLYANERFAEIWRIPRDVLASKNDSLLLESVLDQLCEPQIFLKKVQELYKSRKESFDTINFKDGRVFERLSRPLIQGSKIQGRVWSFRDITARKQAEEQIRLSEERYRMLAENMSDTVWLMDMSLRTTYASPSVTRSRGFTLDDLNNIPLDQQMPPDSLRRLLQLFSDILSLENLAHPHRLISRNIDLEVYKKDGTKFWSENTFTLIRNPQGKPFGILGSGRDISERKIAQDALQNSEKHFRALIENNTDAVVLVDTRGLILYESPAYARMMGWLPGQRLGKSGYEFIHPDDKRFVVKVLNDLIQHPGGVRQTKFRNQHKDGSWRWIEATSTNLLNESAVQGLVINMHDITERKRAEEEIQRRVADLEVLYENGLSVSVLLEPKSIAQKILDILSQKLEWNNAAIRLYHLEIKQVELIALNKPDLNPVDTQVESDRLNKIFASPTQGLSGWVITHGRTIRSGDVLADERYISAFPEIRSGLYVPLMIGDRVLGSISVESSQLDRFSEEDEHLLQTLATQSAIAFENARLYQEAVKAAKRKDALHQGGLEIVRAGQDVEAICRAIHQAAEQVMPAEAFMVSLISEKGQKEETPYLFDRGIRHHDAKVPLSSGITGRVIKSKKSLRIMDVQKTKRAQSFMVDGTEPPRSVLSVPLLVQDKIIGVISAQSRDPDAYSAEDQIFLETLSSEAANAFENARLYQDVVSAAERRAVLYHAGQEIAAAGLDLEQVYNSIHQAIKQLMPLDVFTISLADENRKILHGVYLFDSGERYPAFDSEWGLGLAGHVIEEKKSIRVLDYLKEKPIKAARFGKPGTPRSFIASPLNSGTKIVGVISVQDYRPNIYSEEDEILLKTVAAYAGIAIENSRLFEETRHRLAELESLSQVSVSLTSAVELQPLLENILVGARKAIPAAEKGAILLTEPDGLLRLHALSGYSDPRLIDLFLPNQNGYAARVARERTPLKIDDVHADYEIPFKGEIEEIDAVLSGIAAPLIVKGKVIGVISLDNVSRKAAFTESDLSLLVTFASQAAVAIENARLFSETQQRLHRLSALHSIDAAIGASVDTNVTLNIVLENIMTELKADAAAVLLFNPLTRMLEYASGRGFRAHSIEGLRLRLGEGLAGQSALQRRAINITDLQKTDEVEQVMEHPVSNSASLLVKYHEGENFIGYHAIPLIAKGQIQGVLEIFRRSPMQVDQEWISFFEMLAGQTAIAIDNGRLFVNLQQSNLELTLAYDATIQGWSQALELRDEDTEGHTLRVTDLTLKLIQVMGIEEVETEHARRGSLLHDIGKIAIPDSILLKAGPLDEHEWNVMRQHPQYAYNLLFPITYLRPAIHIPYCHHEKWDGSGYPRGLKGEEIPIVARIFAIVDVFDALTSNRPYRLAWTREKAMEYILEQSGKHFDPRVVNAFMILMAGEK
ncbi:MAG: GAF domain-containing protein [Anaerolineales bacterium]|jgi:PAS domain S-box-containing protein